MSHFSRLSAFVTVVFLAFDTAGSSDAFSENARPSQSASPLAPLLEAWNQSPTLDLRVNKYSGRSDGERPTQQLRLRSVGDLVLHEKLLTAYRRNPALKKVVPVNEKMVTLHYDGETSTEIKTNQPGIRRQIKATESNGVSIFAQPGRLPQMSSLLSTTLGLESLAMRESLTLHEMAKLAWKKEEPLIDGKVRFVSQAVDEESGETTDIVLVFDQDRVLPSEMHFETRVATGAEPERFFGKVTIQPQQSDSFRDYPAHVSYQFGTEAPLSPGAYY